MAFVKVVKKTRNGNGVSPSITIIASGIGINKPFNQLLTEKGIECVNLMYDSDECKLGFIPYTDRETAPRDAYILFGRNSANSMGINCRPFIRDTRLKLNTAYQVRWNNDFQGFVTDGRLEFEE